MKIFLLIIAILTFIVGGILISFSCAYSSTAGGGLSLNFSWLFSLWGLGAIIFGYGIILMARILNRTKGMIFLIFSVLIFISGQIVMTLSKKSIDDKYSGEWAGAEPPDLSCLLIYYLVLISLLVHGLILILKKKP